MSASNPPTPPTPSTTPAGSGERERFTPREIDAVLGRYELGEVRAVREAALGTPASPKAVVDCARGALLLKRRARGVDAPELVAFTHELLLACLAAGVCVPPLVGTRDGNNSMVQADGRVYELSVFIEGTPDPRTPAAAERAGALLAELHRAMDAARGRTAWPAPVEAAVIDPGRVGRAGAGGVDAEIADAVRGVLARAVAFAAGTTQALVHGDWHPGNLLFRGDEPVAVCDFDHARLGAREREVAQGLAQFSLTRGDTGRDPASWPAAADLERLAAHWRGYRAGGGRADAAVVAGLLPGVLMEEGLGASDPRAVWLVLRKAQWLEDHAGAVRDALDRGG